MVDALASGASDRKVVGVQVSPWAPSPDKSQNGIVHKSLLYPLAMTILALSLVACASIDPIDPYVQKLQWLDAADPQADAEQAIKQDDLRLLALATRSLIVPGIESSEQIQYEEACGIQLIEGISDVVRSDEHLRLMQKARSYAQQYNEVIKLHCKI